MRVGLISDSHGQYDRMKHAIALLREAGAEQFIHCGDLGGSEMLDLLAGLKTSFVWGNCDYSRAQLESYATLLGIRCFGSAGRIEAEKKRIAFLHGDDHRLMARLIAEQDCDYLLSGHTHVRDDRKEGRIRLINPGALHRVSQKTVALLDTAADTVAFIAVPDHAK